MRAPMRSFVIMARSDALASEGLERMIERLVACVDAGADAVFPEAITDLPMYRKVRDAVKVPVLANITEFGKTPLYTREELGSRRRRHRAALLLGVSRHESRGAQGVPGHPPRRHAEERARPTCRRATTSTSTSTTTPTNSKLDALFSDGEGEGEMSAPEASAPAGFKPKKSVALSGVTAGNTALCTVGRSGNDLHYRGYDILEVAETCEFEEIAYLLIHGKLPNSRRARRLQGEAQESARHSGAGARRARAAAAGHASHGRACAPARRRWAACCPRRTTTTRRARARSPITCWRASDRCSATGITSRTAAAASTSRPTTTRWAAISCTCCTGAPPPASWVRAMHTSLNLYAEHEFNSSTFTARVIAGTGSDIYSCITGAIGALRGPKHGGANEVALEIQERYATPDEAEADIRRRVANKEIVIGFGHPVYTVSRSAQRHHQARGREARAGSRRPEAVRDRRAHRSRSWGTSRRCSRISTGTAR